MPHSLKNTIFAITKRACYERMNTLLELLGQDDKQAESRL
jgi:hypothetical protein